MPLTLLFIVDPLDELKGYKDSSVAMMRVAAQRGHSIFAATPADLAATKSAVTAHARRLQVHADNDAWYADLGAEEQDLASLSAVLMRKDPPFDVEFLNATLLLSRAAALGARVVNAPRALRDHNEKLSILEFPQFTVPTLVTREAGRIRQFWADHEDIVVKPLDGMGGSNGIPVRLGVPKDGTSGLQGWESPDPIEDFLLSEASAGARVPGPDGGADGAGAGGPAADFRAGGVHGAGGAVDPAADGRQPHGGPDRGGGGSRADARDARGRDCAAR
jgi:hypothetical protein